MHHPLSLFFSDVSPFRAAVLSMFTQLVIFRYAETIFSIERGTITMGFVNFTELDSGLVRQVFAMCGSSITTIMFMECMHNDGSVEKDAEYRASYAQKLASLLIDHLQNVTELRFFQSGCASLNWSVEGSVFRKFSSQFTYL